MTVPELVALPRPSAPCCTLTVPVLAKGTSDAECRLDAETMNVPALLKATAEPSWLPIASSLPTGAGDREAGARQVVDHGAGAEVDQVVVAGAELPGGGGVVVQRGAVDVGEGMPG